MCSRPHFVGIKEDGRLNYFPWRFLFINYTWNSIILNIDRNGYIQHNIWCLKCFSKCGMNSCYPANVGELCFLTHKILRLHVTCILHYNLVGVINSILFSSCHTTTIVFLNSQLTMQPPPLGNTWNYPPTQAMPSCQIIINPHMLGVWGFLYWLFWPT